MTDTKHKPTPGPWHDWLQQPNYRAMLNCSPVQFHALCNIAAASEKVISARDNALLFEAHHELRAAIAKAIGK